MKLVYISPTNMSSTEAGIKEKARREEFLNHITSNDVSVQVVDNPEGPLSIQTMQDEYNGIPGMLRIAAEMQTRIDGVLIGCFGEPGLDAVREMLDVPVVGCCAPAIHLANQIGKRFSVLSPVPSTVPFTIELVEKYGLGTHLASIRPLNIPVLEIRSNRAQAVAKATAIAKRIVEEDGADTLVLGCMSMAFQDMAKDMAQNLCIPVLNPIYSAVSTLEFLVRFGITQSPLVYKL